ncbi:MAG: hypothetical protein ACJA1E_001196, partial [Paracoccaceae bacterium]
MVDELFAQFEGYPARQGYIARGGQILDASIVPVPHNHDKRAEDASIKADETPAGRADKPAKRSQKDVDARWTRKHGKSHYGYEDHLDVDRKHKLVRRYHVSPSQDIAWQCPGRGNGCRLTAAAVHDSQAVHQLLTRGNTCSGVRADA